jgi:anaerobic C4-dicarboxylate transporter
MAMFCYVLTKTLQKKSKNQSKIKNQKSKIKNQKKKIDQKSVQKKNKKSMNLFLYPRCWKALTCK